MKRAVPRSEQQNEQQLQRTLSRNSSRTNNGRGYDQHRTKKIFVGGLSANLTEEEFRSYFEKFGTITDVVVMHDNITQRPRGFGFITFDSENSVEEVVQKNFHELTGKLVEVKRAVPKDGTSSISNNSYNGRVGGGRGPNANSYQQASYATYNPRFGYFPTTYGHLGGYPYGTGIYSGAYPSGGYTPINYGYTPVAPRSPWSPAMVGFRGYFPYGTAAAMYVNGAPGAMGHTGNGYSGVLGNGFSGESMQMGGGDAQHADESTPSQAYSTYVNGAPVAMGPTANGYSGKLGNGFSGKSKQTGGGDGQHEDESTLCQKGTNL